MTTREHVHEIIVGGDEVMGLVWWDPDAKKLDSDTPKVLDYLKDKTYQGVTYHDGVKFLQYLGRMLDNSYVHARSVD